MDHWTFQGFPKDDFRKVPTSPGVYKYLNKEGTIIYVGKAKNLRKRVSNYFLAGTNHTLKTTRLVKQVSEIEFVIVNNEYEALVLENSLIKENQPKFNIMLKDGKSYPYICITNERFPRVFSTRRVNLKKGEFFGPFTSVRAMNNVLHLIKKLYKIRTCNLNLSKKNVSSGKYNVCLEYHVKNCKGPCTELQSEANYMQDISEIREITKGNLTPIKTIYKIGIERATSELRFEDAHELKLKLDSLDSFKSKSLVANPKITNTDVFTIESEKDKFYINYMRIDEGAIKLSETIEIKRKLEEDKSEILPLVMFNLRNKFNSPNQTIITNIECDTWEDVTISVPIIGDKKKLIELSLKNVHFFKKENLLQTPSLADKTLLQLKQDLALSSLPRHIECFDNSNIQGSNPVASMVFFKNSKPLKSEYRKFRIKTVEGSDDFKSMEEIVTRRYNRLISEKKTLPDLIVIDGGKGQLAAACQALKSINLYGQIPIVGIAKKLEEIYLPNDPYPVHIDKKSLSLRLLQRVRDEAHRFAITFHRHSRSTLQTTSELDSISGIGDKTRNILLSQYKSAERIKNTSITEMAQWIGLSKSQLVNQALNKKKGS